MRVYLDICCLKRPFDDQMQVRVAVESAAVVAILRAAERGDLELLRSAAHHAENATDPDPERRAAVGAWLGAGPPPREASEGVRGRFAAFRAAGFGQMDALHLAWAEELRADVLLTTDDRMASLAARQGNKIRARVLNPAAFSQELRR